MKKSVYVKCFLSKNFGDDLFLKVLCDRYNEKFYLYSSIDYPHISKNLEIKKINIFGRIIRKIFYISKKDNIYQFLLSRKSKIIIVIGGSLFIEKTFKEFKLYKMYSKFKEYYIIGANIGPFFSNEFVKKINQVVFFNAKDVCLRDKKSYDLFKILKNVRYAPDIIFFLPVKKYINNEENIVIFSIIDCYKKAGQIKNPNAKNYEILIKDLICFYQKKNFKIKLFSFCKFEGDEKAINRIYDQLEDKNNVSKYFYDGNIDEALDVFSRSKVIIGTRFHANILGLIMNKVIIPIIYNDKTENLLYDINFKGIVYDINKLDNYNGLDIDENKLSYKCDVSKQIKDSQRHFEKLDKVLKRKD